LLAPQLNLDTSPSVTFRIRRPGGLALPTGEDVVEVNRIGPGREQQNARDDHPTSSHPSSPVTPPNQWPGDSPRRASRL
jgi:hypothetical protein